MHRPLGGRTLNINTLAISKPGPISEKAIAKHITDPSKWKLQRKLDGHFRVMYRDMDGVLHAYGTRFSTVTGKREDALHKCGAKVIQQCAGLPRGSGIAGEVVCPGNKTQATDTARKENWDNNDFYAFHVEIYNNKPFVGPLATSRECARGWDIPWVEEINNSILHILGLQCRYEETLEELLDFSKAKKWEGLILKGASWDPSFKIKVEETFDLVVKGYTDAEYGKTGQFFGMIGALICETSDGIEVAKCSGMTVVDRKRFTEYPPIGQVIEVRAQGLAADGRLRHPRFKRMRLDKSPEQADTLASLRSKCK
jgi:hypothetical protein